MKLKESALWKFDEYHKHQDYKKFNTDTAKNFRKHLEKYKTRTGAQLNVKTRYNIMRHVKDFFTWLSTQSGYKSKINLDDVAYLRLSKADTKMATSIKIQKYPSLDYIKKMCSFPVSNEIDRRDRALISFTALSAMRDLAIVTLPIGCFDPNNLMVTQDPAQGVQTKFSKLTYTTLFKFDSTLIQYVLDWHEFLTKELLFDNTNPLFPSTHIEQESDTNHSFTAKGVSREFWSNADSMRKIFKQRASQQALEYYSPHKFRHFAIGEANKYAVGAEQMKAISQNVGHERLSTTFYGYGNVDSYRVADIIDGMDFTNE